MVVKLAVPLAVVCSRSSSLVFTNDVVSELETVCFVPEVAVSDVTAGMSVVPIEAAADDIWSLVVEIRCSVDVAAAADDIDASELMAVGVVLKSRGSVVKRVAVVVGGIRYVVVSGA